MNIVEQIKEIRTVNGLSQKEVHTNANLYKAQYFCIEGGKTDLTVTTLEKIKKTLGCSLADLPAFTDELREINSRDKTPVEKVALMEMLTDEERKTIYTLPDACIGKRKLKDAPSGVLQDVK
jgi:transcriptional regulator with XRE-family HTH domain